MRRQDMESNDVSALVGKIFQLKTIDFKTDRSLLKQYIELRNSYSELLLAAPVTPENTLEWLKRDDIEVKGLADNNTLFGAVILYLGRRGEVAFFVREKNRGTGGRLLDLIEYIAEQKKLKSIWSWVLKENLIAQRVFEKNGFKKEGETIREYKGMPMHGLEFKKMSR